MPETGYPVPTGDFVGTSRHMLGLYLKLSHHRLLLHIPFKIILPIDSDNQNSSESFVNPSKLV
jgi:hypothetical protein